MRQIYIGRSMVISLSTAIWIGLVLRIIIAIWNSFFGPSPGADMDALTFHFEAVANSLDFSWYNIQFTNGKLYTHLLGAIYYFLIDSIFLGSLLSCLAWLLSALILSRVMVILSASKAASVKAMLIYSLLPSSIFLTGATLREPYQMLFVSIVTLSVLQIYLHRSTVHRFVLIFGLAGLSTLHGTLFLFAVVVLMMLLIFLIFRPQRSLSIRTIVLFIVFGALILYFGLSLFIKFSYGFGDDFYKTLTHYNQIFLSTSARGTYVTPIVLSDMIDFLIFLPNNFFQYLAEPLPWHVTAFKDLPLLVENMVRLNLICVASFRLLVASSLDRRPVLLVFFLYLILEGMWSLGTGNWGTAARHHLPSLGLLLVAAFALSGRTFSKRNYRKQSSYNSASK